MYDTLYLVAKDSNGGKWYNLRIRDTHFCISCGGDLDKILNMVKVYTKRYKNADRLLRAMSKLDGGGRVSPATYTQCEEQYRKEGHIFNDLLHRTIEEAYKEAREEAKLNSPMHKAKTRLKKAGGVKTISIEEVVLPTVAPVEENTKDISPILPRKPKLIKRK